MPTMITSAPSCAQLSKISCSLIKSAVSVIETPYIRKIGTKAGPIARFFLRHPRFKHWMRMLYSLIALWKLKRASLEGSGYKDYWQAGKSVEGIDSVESVAELMSRYKSAL